MHPTGILQELVAIPSVNPMGRDVDSPEFYEERLTEWLTGYLGSLGVALEVHEVAPRRANVLARVDGPRASTTVLLDAHQDTVPVEGMTIDPFRPVIENGRLYGRGACDVKGGLAAMLAAFTRLARERPAGMANVVLSCTCDEEATSLGVAALVAPWQAKTDASAPTR
ncbi:MAG: M20/M25/M40 family metallo-hydrolase, partial [Planctomycetes bacterium]|nr:M20/M25/M40 family metallo-hydrolase [Planctomycetota bacterium]